MEKLGKYKSELKFLNIVLEFILILIAYGVATLLRIVIPLGRNFDISDSLRFIVIGIVFTMTIIIVTYCMGSYFTFHIDGLLLEARKVLLSIIIGISIDCVIIYLFRLEQFSRMLLFYFALLSYVFVLIKRVAFSMVVKSYDEKYKVTSNVLMVGSGRLAQLVYDTILKRKVKNLSLFGYVADAANDNIPNYLGNIEFDRSIIDKGNIEIILIAEEGITNEKVKDIVILATHYDIRVAIVPGFSEFMPSKRSVSQVEGNYLFELTALDTCEIMGVNISVINIEKTIGKIKENLYNWKGKYICVSNVHTTVTAFENEEYREIQNRAVIALPDGGPLSKFSLEHGYNGARRVTGPDLMKRILEESAKNGWSHYFYGSTQEVLDKLKNTIESKYPGTNICGMLSPPFRPLTVQEDIDIISKINKADPDFIWVGLGAPKQEVWMAAHENKVCGLMIGVGAAFDYEVGKIKRAPLWMQKMNLEWLYRLIQDPKRLFSRYLRTNTKYIIWKCIHGGKHN